MPAPSGRVLGKRAITKTSLNSDLLSNYNGCGLCPPTTIHYYLLLITSRSKTSLNPDLLIYCPNGQFDIFAVANSIYTHFVRIRYDINSFFLSRRDISNRRYIERFTHIENSVRNLYRCRGQRPRQTQICQSKNRPDFRSVYMMLHFIFCQAPAECRQ